MDAAAAHMERLLKRARATQDIPADGSFLPLSLALACLVRHPPPPLSLLLAGAAGGPLFSLSDPSRTAPEAVDTKLKRELSAIASGSSAGAMDERLFEATRALVMYVRTVRGVLAACSSHLKRQTLGREDDACQEIICVVLREVTTASEPSIEGEKALRAPSAPPKPLRSKIVAVRPALTPVDAPRSVPPPVRPVADASGIVKRAVGRDAGDGSAILDTMAKFAGDERVQTHAVRAAKGAVRSLLRSEATRSHQHQEDELEGGDAPERRLVGAVIDRMVQFPSALALQRDGLLCLRDVATFDSGGSGGVRMLTAFGGVAALVNALARLPDDLEANGAGLAVLAHPAIADDSTVRVDPESHRLVLSAMRRFPLDEQVQGLGALALGNLSLRHDASRVEIVAKGGLDVVLASMKRFADTALVQASGCRFLAVVSATDEQSAEACLDAGALPVSEKARVRFPDDPKVQQYAVAAIHGMMPPETSTSPTLEPGGGAHCAIQ